MRVVQRRAPCTPISSSKGNSLKKFILKIKLGIPRGRGIPKEKVEFMGRSAWRTAFCDQGNHKQIEIVRV